MKKIHLSLVPLIASAVLNGCSGCGEPQKVSRACLDPQGNVVPNQVCEDMYAHNGQTVGHPDWYYYWYYMRSSNVYHPGRRVVVFRGSSDYVAGKFTPPPGVVFEGGSSVGVVRGGFGMFSEAVSE